MDIAGKGMFVRSRVSAKGDRVYLSGAEHPGGGALEFGVKQGQVPPLFTMVDFHGRFYALVWSGRLVLNAEDFAWKVAPISDK